MVAATKIGPQLRLGEELLDNPDLLALLEERAEAKTRYEDARGYLEDYIEQHGPYEGEYRVGPYRLRLSSKRSPSVTVPKK